MGILIGLNFDVGVSLPIDSKEVVVNLTARDALLNKYEGLKTYVISEQKNYQLIGGTTNDKWVNIPITFDLSSYYTSAQVDTAIGLAITNLVDTAPSTLDTLHELATALGDDPNFATTMTNLIGGKLSSTDVRISNWDASYGWGNHAGLYEPVLGNPAADNYFLISTMAGARSWVALPSTLYTNASATPTTLGGIPSGSTFNLKTMQEMWDSFLYPYQVPVFTAFAVTGFASIIECGVNFTGGAQTFSWTLSNPSNVNANSIAIRDITNTTDLLTGLANDGSEGFTLTAATKTTTGDYIQCGIRATDSKTNQIGYRYITTYFYSPFYSGVGSAALNVAGLQALTKSVSAKSSKTISYTTVNQKFYFAYPASYGDLSSIIDQNGYTITSAFTKTQVTFTNNPTNYNGISVLYNVYESNALSTMGPYGITFNF
jgi:hypothetical protein